MDVKKFDYKEFAKELDDYRESKEKRKEETSKKTRKTKEFKKIELKHNRNKKEVDYFLDLLDSYHTYINNEVLSDSDSDNDNYFNNRDGDKVINYIKEHDKEYYDLLLEKYEYLKNLLKELY